MNIRLGDLNGWTDCMIMLKKNANFKRFSDWMYLIAGFALLCGFGLSILSWMNICTEACQEGHKYRLYGLKFEPFGIVYFVLALILYLWSWTNRKMIFILGLFLAMGLGSEIQFILVQKFQIGQWCPICLAIAGSISLACLALITYNLTLNQDGDTSEHHQKGEMMNRPLKGSALIGMVVVGFLFAFGGVGKVDTLAAAETTVKDQLAFGNQDSRIEAYVFTDWQCPACRKLEPTLREIYPQIENEAKIFFVDLDIHPESLNFTPFHLSFIINNKDQYWNLRDMLTEIARMTVEPTEEEVEKGAAKHGVHYKQLNYADVALGMRYYKRLGRQFGVKSTPTVVIISSDTKKGKKLTGAGEITTENVLKSISSLRKD